MKYIKASNAKYPVFFGMREINTIEENIKKGIGDLLIDLQPKGDGESITIPSFSVLFQIAIAGLNGGARKEKKDTITEDQAEEILEEAEGALLEIFEIFSLSINKYFHKSDIESGNAPAPGTSKTRKK